MSRRKSSFESHVGGAERTNLIQGVCKTGGFYIRSKTLHRMLVNEIDLWSWLSAYPRLCAGEPPYLFSDCLATRPIPMTAKNVWAQ